MVPSVISFSSAISACEDAGAWREALEVLRWMQKDLVRPNVMQLGQYTVV